MSNASAFELDALDTRIKELVTYARERGGEDRSLLFRNLVDLFLTGKAPQKQPTRQQLIDVIEALIPHVEEENRRTASELLAHMSAPPVDLALCLAKDDPKVVGELLNSQAFDEDHIIEIIAHTGRDHHQAIASRNDLSANVWIALARAVPKADLDATQPSLSLWSEDLGTRTEPAQHGATVMQLHPEQTEENKPDDHSASWNMSEQSDTPAAQAQDEERQTRQAASLRILRTDKDLISERIENAKDNASIIEEARHENEAVDHSAAIAQAPVSSENEPPHKSWSWRSDRDGMVAGVSMGYDVYFPNGPQLEGLSILDMLSLNTKLGHPVSRAFQRRSTIHDAPITLDSADEDHRHWTLDAKPIFSPSGGTFEGYEGRLSSVVAEEKDKYEISNIEKGASPVFLEEQDPTTQKNMPHTAITDENIDRTRTPAPAAQSTADATTQQSQSPLASAESMMAETAANAVKDVLAETLSSMLQSTQPQKPAKSDAEPEPTSEIAATLQLLEDAIAKLAETKANGGSAPARLQAEIATACLRSLKEQLDIERN